MKRNWPTEFRTGEGHVVVKVPKEFIDFLESRLPEQVLNELAPVIEDKISITKSQFYAAWAEASKMHYSELSCLFEIDPRKVVTVISKKCADDLWKRLAT